MAKKQASKYKSLQRLPNKSLISVIVVVAVVAALGGYWTARASHADTPSIKICVAPPYSTQGCLVSNGPDKIVTAGGKTQALWQQIPVGFGSQTAYEFQNASGHCLTVNNAVNQSGTHDVVMDPGACEPQNSSEIWTVSQTSPLTLTDHTFACNLHTPVGFFTDGNVDCVPGPGGTTVDWAFYNVN